MVEILRAFGPLMSHIGPWITERPGSVELFAKKTGARARSEPHVAPLNPRARVELLDWRAAWLRIAAWSDLATRALERNVFLEPSFALAAAQHVSFGRPPGFLFVTEANRETGDRLIGVCALELGQGQSPLTRAWTHKQGALGTPLLDRSRSLEAMRAILDWARTTSRNKGLLWPQMASHGPTASLIRSLAQTEGLRIHEFSQGERAILPAGADVETMFSTGVSHKHLRELRRQRRRLAEAGELSYVSARQPDEMKRVLENFLHLEASGWKGRRGTALICDPATAAFTRVMIRRLSRDHQCHIESLEVNGAPVAMGIILRSGDNAFLWKIAFDPSHAASSPGVQLILEFSRRQVLDGGIAFTDSCAIPDHPMIDRLWSDRLPIVDLAIATSASAGKAFETAVSRETMRRGVRAGVKNAFYAATGRRRS